MDNIFEQYSSLGKKADKKIGPLAGRMPTEEEATKMFKPFTIVVDKINDIIGKSVVEIEKDMGTASALATISSALAFIVATWAIYVKKNSETNYKLFVDKFGELTMDAINTIEKG
jgi:hypothetical protein